MVYLYGFTTEGPIDGWFLVWSALAFLIYNTIDNIDGKQARRTGSGSPLGMLFDHGLDACTCVIINIMYQRCVQIGSGWRALLSMIMSSVPFYYVNLEAYYLGVMTLPTLTGPDTAGIIHFFLFMYTAYYGSEALWQ